MRRFLQQCGPVWRCAVTAGLSVTTSGLCSAAQGQARGPGLSALPEAPAVQQAAGSCTLEGKVRGADGGIVPGASLTLLGEGKVRERTATADDDGDYLMDNVPCGQFVLSVTMPGFSPAALGGEMLDAGEVLQKDVTLRLAGANASVNVIATRMEIAQAQVGLQEQQRLLSVFPNFFVSYQWSAEPLHARQKFGLALHNAADPANVGLAAVVAGVQQASNSLPGYGQGAAGYGRRFGANLGDEVTGTFLGGAILPSIFRQDPRYFYRGTGSTKSRLWYAVSRAFVTRGDNGKTQVNYSGLLGDFGTGAISNLYAAKEDREGGSLTVENGLLGIVGDCVNNTLQELVLRRVTSKTSGRRGKATDGTGAP
ncbi:carboxypeptidase-like regulatory domain-containing protein [Terriglobus sp.]|uniref:carboxypeptidase-like regulatory domain-containing protein n=1 Tax=Terriglobus sp. TaxID=1889013 RepID=UPI003AFFA43B